MLSTLVNRQIILTGRLIAESMYNVKIAELIFVTRNSWVSLNAY